MIATFRDDVAGGIDIPIEDIDENSIVAKEPDLLALRAEVADREWNLGRTPEFSHHLETRIDGVAVFDVRMQVINGRIEEAVIFSDALYPDVIDKAMAALHGIEYGRHGVRAALGALASEVSEGGPQTCLQALSDWLVAN